VDDAVEAGVRGGQGEVDGVLAVPGGRVVVAAEAGHAVFLREQLVEGFDTLPFHATQLGNRGAGGDLDGEPGPVHAAGDLGAAFVVGPAAGLWTVPDVVDTR